MCDTSPVGLLTPLQYFLCEKRVHVESPTSVVVTLSLLLQEIQYLNFGSIYDPHPIQNVLVKTNEKNIILQH